MRNLGGGWEQLQIESNDYLYGVAGSGPNDLWVIALNRMLHYDGKTWTVEPFGQTFSYNALWASGQNDVCAIGPVAVRYDGTRWVQEQIPHAVSGYTSISGSSSNDLWVLGNKTAFYWDGTSWQTSSLDIKSFNPTYLMAPSTSELWVGNGTDVRRYFGGAGNWNYETHTGVYWGSATAAGEAAFYASSYAVQHYVDGTYTSSTLTGQPGITALWNDNSDSIWAVGNWGALRHYQAGIWTNEQVGSTPNLQDTWFQDNNLYGCDINGGLWRWDGTTWASVSAPPSFYTRAIGGTSPEDLWVVGAAGTAAHFDGVNWTVHDVGAEVELADVVALSPNDVWVAGGAGVVSHYDGTAWTPTTLTGSMLNSLHRSVSGELYVLGNSCSLFRLEKGAWVAANSPCPQAGNLDLMWAFSDSDQWVLGKSSSFGQTMYHYDGSTWTRVQDFSNTTLNTLWASGPKDIYAAGDFGHLYRYNGVSWERQQSAARTDFTSMIGASSSDVWLVGSGGHTLHRSVAPGPCDGVTCSGFGTCSATNGIPSCTCNPGYHTNGLTCAADPNPCSSVTCSGQGTCYVINLNAECGCNPGFVAQGPNCVAALDLSYEECKNGIDEDEDGLLDCVDSDCIESPVCFKAPIGEYVNQSSGTIAVLTLNSDGTCARKATSTGTASNCTYQITSPSAGTASYGITFSHSDGSAWDSYTLRVRSDALFLQASATASPLAFGKKTPLSGLGSSAPTDYVDIGAVEDEAVEATPLAIYSGARAVLPANGRLRVQFLASSGYPSSGTAKLAGPLVAGVPSALIAPLPAETDYSASFQVPTAGEYLLLISSSAPSYRVRRFDAADVPLRYFPATLWGASIASGAGVGVRIGDVNHDGRNDLVVPVGSAVLVYLQEASGLLGAPTSYVLNNSAASRSVVLGNFDGDNHPDIGVAGIYGISLLHGNGDGTFGKPWLYHPSSVGASGHLSVLKNGSGLVDFAVAGSNGVFRLKGDGQGDFSFATVAAVPMHGYDDMKAEDLNGDGFTDLAFASGQSGYGTLSVIEQPSWKAENYPIHGNNLNFNADSLAIGSVMGDSTPEILIAHTASYTIAQSIDVYARRPDGRYGFVRELAPLGGSARELEIVNLDHRALSSVVVNLTGSPAIVRHHEGKWRWSTYRTKDNQSLSALTVGDINGDNCADLVGVSSTSYLQIDYGSGCGK
jgi:hypothetical protein